MELDRAIEERRSIRKFKDQPVSEEDIKTLIKSALYAPSWANTQVSRFYVALGEKKSELEKCLHGFNQKNVRGAGALIVCAVVKGKSGYRNDLGAFTHLGEGFRYFDNGLRVQNICLKAYEMGLGTLIIGGYDPKPAREFFSIPETEEVVCLLAVGYPDTAPQKPKGLSVEDVTVIKK